MLRRSGRYNVCDTLCRAGLHNTFRFDSRHFICIYIDVACFGQGFCLDDYSPEVYC